VEECRVRKTIPVFRAASLTPMIKWLVARGRPVEDMLRRSGIGYVWIEEPYVPVPVRAAERFVLEAARLEGPDFGCRVLSPQSLKEIAAVGFIGLSGRTPREGLARICHVMPFHSSHQILSVSMRAKESVIHEYWSIPIDPEAHHIFQQYVAGLIQILIGTARPDEPAFTRMEVVPHPRYGLEHLKPWFNADLVSSVKPVMAINVPNATLDAPMRTPRRDRAIPIDGFPWQKLRDGTMTGSARHLVRAMLREGSPTIDRLSILADMSVRTLQRRLADEGETFSDLVERVRRDVALDALNATDAPIGDVSANLGYSKQSSLTRAVRRWTGQSPAALRSERLAATEL
jgi:AraC-like DNA-binding protein